MPLTGNENYETIASLMEYLLRLWNKINNVDNLSTAMKTELCKSNNVDNLSTITQVI